jgi:hypothetical protein
MIILLYFIHGNQVYKKGKHFMSMENTSRKKEIILRAQQSREN